MDLTSSVMRSRSFKEDFHRVKKFESQIKSICADIFIVNAPFEYDVKYATDLLILEIMPFRIACRVRTNSYLIDKYKYQFTIRNERPREINLNLKRYYEAM